MRLPFKFAGLTALIAGLLLPIAPAQALPVNWAPAGWTDYYAGTAAKSIVKPAAPNVSHPKNATTLSTFNINYVNVPENEKSAIQAAVDAEIVVVAHISLQTPYLD